MDTKTILIFAGLGIGGIIALSYLSDYAGESKKSNSGGPLFDADKLKPHPFVLSPDQVSEFRKQHGEPEFSTAKAIDTIIHAFNNTTH